MRRCDWLLHPNATQCNPIQYHNPPHPIPPHDPNQSIPIAQFNPLHNTTHTPIWPHPSQPNLRQPSPLSTLFWRTGKCWCGHYLRGCALGDGCVGGLLDVAWGMHGGLPALQDRGRGWYYVSAGGGCGKPKYYVCFTSFSLMCSVEYVG